jgi:dihydroorotate dehydrogenase
MYKLIIRPILFLFDPEKVHHFTFSLLKIAGKIPGVSTFLKQFYVVENQILEKEILGLHFKNRVGLAAGFDKDAKLIDELSCFGFGFIEIGTLTPKPQGGNDKPRLFRLPQDGGLINRMGFNNQGAVAAIEKIKTSKIFGSAATKKKLIIGGNIGKNKITPNEDAVADYEFCFETLYPYVDYFVVNVSSPNTPGLRELQEKEPLQKLLAHVKSLSLKKEKPKPVLLKIAPDLSISQLDDVIEILKLTKTDGIIATNTTLSREGLTTSSNEINAIGNGGLSGKPLAKKANEVITYLRKNLGVSYPIIGVGGILTVQDAVDKLDAGADLIQLYTGFIYKGPGFVKEINQAIINRNG